MAKGDTQDKKSILIFFFFFTYLIFSLCSHTKEMTNLTELKILSPSTFQMQACRA